MVASDFHDFEVPPKLKEQNVKRIVKEGSTMLVQMDGKAVRFDIVHDKCQKTMANFGKQLKLLGITNKDLEQEIILTLSEHWPNIMNGKSGNGHTNNISNTNRQEGEEENLEPKEYEVFKCSKDTYLAEEITLGNTNVFLQIDNDGNNPIIRNEIDLSEEQNMILKPHERGTASPIIPYSFKDIEEIQYFIKQAQLETIDSLFLKHKSIWNKIVSADKEIIVMLATDSLYSYFQDRFATTHYDMFVGPPDSGKGAILLGFKYLGYRVVLASDMSGANLLDLLSSIEANQVTLAEDELDDIFEDKDKLRIYKVGYDNTSIIPRTLDGSTSSRSNRYYYAFCFKIFAAEERLDERKLEGFKDRIFTNNAKKGKPKIYVKRLSEKTDSKKYNDVISKIEYLRKLTLVFRLIHGNDIIEDVNTNIDDRALELTGPQIRLFNSDKLASKDKSVLNNEVLSMLSSCLRNKGELTKKTLDGTIYLALKELLPTADKKVILDDENPIRLILSHKTICNKICELTEGSDIVGREHAFYCVDYREVTHNKILRICRDRFEAENDYIHFTITDETTGKEKEKGERALSFNENSVTKAASSFNVISDIKILEPEEDDNDDDDENETEVWTDWKSKEKGYDDDDSNNDNDSFIEESTCQSATILQNLGHIEEIGTKNNKNHDDSNNSQRSQNDDSSTNVNSSELNHTDVKDLGKDTNNNQNIIESGSSSETVKIDTVVTDKEKNDKNSALSSYNEPKFVKSLLNDNKKDIEQTTDKVFKCFYCDFYLSNDDERVKHIKSDHDSKLSWPTQEDFDNRDKR